MFKQSMSYSRSNSCCCLRCKILCCNGTDKSDDSKCDQYKKLVEDYPLDIKVAVMGCVVNGPGEAKEADLGVAGGIGEGLLIKHGEIIKKLPEDQLLPALKEELDHWS